MVKIFEEKMIVFGLKQDDLVKNGWFLVFNLDQFHLRWFEVTLVG